MAELEKTIKALKDWKNDPLAMNAEIDPCLVDDALSVIESLQWENKIITENITEIDKQRGEIAIRWEKLRLENKRLKEQKSVEPKTGHWICGKYDDIFMCSSCEKYSMDDYPYCHWCGAKMKQEGR